MSCRSLAVQQARVVRRLLHLLARFQPTALGGLDIGSFTHLSDFFRMALGNSVLGSLVSKIFYPAFQHADLNPQAHLKCHDFSIPANAKNIQHCLLLTSLYPNV